MNRIFKLELKRAFINRSFVISIILGGIIAILQVAERAIPFSSVTILYPNEYPPSVFNTCMGFYSSMWSSVFFLIFPILAALPFSDSFLVDKKSGYLQNIYTRGKKYQYLISKYLSVFLSGGAAVIIPLIVNLFIVCLCVPAVTPIAATGFFPIFGYATGAYIYYTYPFLYIFLFYLLIFITAGILSCTALFFSFFVRFKYIALLTPFLLFMSISYGSMLFSPKSSFNISQWIIPSQPYGALNIWLVAVELLILLIIPGSIYFIKGYQNDTF